MSSEIGGLLHIVGRRRREGRVDKVSARMECELDTSEEEEVLNRQPMQNNYGTETHMSWFTVKLDGFVRNVWEE